MRKTVYVILALCCFIIKTYSINRPYYHFKQLSIKEGLPTSITSLYDDKNGSLWVGTTQGIYRFNGEKIKKYKKPVAKIGFFVKISVIYHRCLRDVFEIYPRR